MSASSSSAPRVITGLAVITVGAIALLSALGLGGLAAAFATWWPLLVILVGVASLMSQPRQFIWPLFVISLGVALQLRALHVIAFDFWAVFWPLCLIVLGLSLVFRQTAPDPEALEQDRVNVFVAFSGSKTINFATDFRGGQVTALFGGAEIDLRKAEIKDRARIDVLAAFGGAEIRVPEHWTVVTNGLPLFGGWDNKTTKPSKTSPVLEINGTCLFGGFEVKN